VKLSKHHLSQVDFWCPWYCPSEEVCSYASCKESPPSDCSACCLLVSCGSMVFPLRKKEAYSSLFNFCYAHNFANLYYIWSIFFNSSQLKVSVACSYHCSFFQMYWIYSFELGNQNCTTVLKKIKEL